MQTLNMQALNMQTLNLHSLNIGVDTTSGAVSSSVIGFSTAAVKDSERPPSHGLELSRFALSLLQLSCQHIMAFLVHQSTGRLRGCSLKVTANYTFENPRVCK